MAAMDNGQNHTVDSEQGMSGKNTASLPRRLGSVLLLVVAWLAASAFAVWTYGALHYDLQALRVVVLPAFPLGVLCPAFLVRGAWRKLLLAVLPCFVVLVWWCSLQPRNDRSWQADVAELPWADIQGDEITLHNVRDFDYRSSSEYTPRWETRTVRLSKITGADLFVNYWGSPWMAHPVVSFQIEGERPVCFSIETRKELGESYSAIGGFYRQFELYYVVAEERDVVRLRACVREGETSYLYRTRMPAERARERFMEYVRSVNSLRDHPRWYHALATNCTTAIRGQHPAGKRHAWDWRMIVNGKADELLYERGLIVTDGLSFGELRKRALINDAAEKAGFSPDFDVQIRRGRPGFQDASARTDNSSSGL
jgi:hypothetical protein